MDVNFQLRGQGFEWDAEKASANVRKHHVSFETACEVFFDPFVRLVDAGELDEAREAAIGFTEDWDLLFVVHVIRHENTIRIISARPALSRGGTMKMSERIRKRLQRDRPMTSVTLRIPQDVIDDLKAVAPTLGFSGYQPLIRAYIGQGLRKDLARLERDQMKLVVDSLRRQGVDDQVIAEAIAEAKAHTA